MSSFRAARTQTPPPEENEVVNSNPFCDPTRNMARRLYLAHGREVAWRARRMQEEEIPIPDVTDPAQLAPIWYTVARKLIALKCKNPERFMHAQHMYSTCSETTLARALYTQTLLRDDAFKRFAQYDAQANDLLTEELRSNCSEFECALNEAALAFPHKTDRELWTYIFSCCHLGLSSLFKLCMAVAEGLDAVAKEHCDEAYQQFLTDPIGYVEVWAEAIPQDFKDAASKLLLTTL